MLEDQQDLPTPHHTIGAGPDEGAVTRLRLQGNARLNVAHPEVLGTIDVLPQNVSNQTTGI
jgi:hypothetical protein